VAGPAVRAGRPVSTRPDSGIQPARYTVFDTPVLSPMIRWISSRLLGRLGWRFDGVMPADLRQAVLIAAPHTSNWDLPYALMAAFALGRKVHWLGKRQIFRFPFRGLMRWLGGIPVDRSRSNNLVEAAVRCFNGSSEPLLLIVPPEGTRSAVAQWKTGFYYIAMGARVPVVMAYMDHATRVCGASRVFQPTGDIERDMSEIRQFYAPFRGWVDRG
jgi:1-acyl-sn-glycerol-3-phosphate acyltransferase